MAASPSALAEMAMASGIGAEVNQLDGGDPIPLFFGEDQGRYVVTLAPDKLDYFYDEIYPYAGIFVPWIGTTGGSSLKLGEARFRRKIKGGQPKTFPLRSSSCRFAG
jgi:phosphoribosylformylglycinamidine (FGAM) synthase-like enzyme